MSVRSLSEAAPIASQPVTPRTSAQKPAPVAPSDSSERSPFQRVIDGLGKEINSGEHMMRGALAAGQSGADVGPGQLLALQAGVYRYGEAVDLASKLIDRTSSGVKTIINGGGQ